VFFKSLIGRILVLSLLLFTVAIGAVTMLHIRREHQYITQTSLETAELMLSVIIPTAGCSGLPIPTKSGGASTRTT